MPTGEEMKVKRSPRSNEPPHPLAPVPTEAGTDQVLHLVHCEEEQVKQLETGGLHAPA